MRGWCAPSPSMNSGGPVLEAIEALLRLPCHYLGGSLSSEYPSQTPCFCWFPSGLIDAPATPKASCVSTVVVDSPVLPWPLTLILTQPSSSMQPSLHIHVEWVSPCVDSLLLPLVLAKERDNCCTSAEHLWGMLLLEQPISETHRLENQIASSPKMADCFSRASKDPSASGVNKGRSKASS